MLILETGKSNKSQENFSRENEFLNYDPNISLKRQLVSIAALMDCILIKAYAKLTCNRNKFCFSFVFFKSQPQGKKYAKKQPFKKYIPTDEGRKKVYSCLKID